MQVKTKYFTAFYGALWIDIDPRTPGPSLKTAVSLPQEQAMLWFKIIQKVSYCFPVSPKCIKLLPFKILQNPSKSY